MQLFGKNNFFNQNVPQDNNNAFLTTLPKKFAKKPENYLFIVRKKFLKNWSSTNTFSCNCSFWTGISQCSQPCWKIFPKGLKVSHWLPETDFEKFQKVVSSSKRSTEHVKYSFKDRAEKKLPENPETLRSKYENIKKTINVFFGKNIVFPQNVAPEKISAFLTTLPKMLPQRPKKHWSMSE